MIDKNMTVNELLRKYPQVQPILDKYYVDYCCGGHRTLEEAAREHNFSLEEFIKEVEVKLSEGES